MERVGWAVGDADDLENRPQEPIVEEYPVAPPTFAGR